MDTKKVDLHQIFLLVIHPTHRTYKLCIDPLDVRPDVGGHSGDEAHELVALGDPDPRVPLLEVAGRLQGPRQELRAVVEPEM